MLKLDKLHELHEPILLKNIIHTTNEFSNWELIDWSLEDFADKCGDLKLPFRVGKNIETINPQWEVETPIEYKSVKEFLNDIKQENDLTKWFYFDYKHMNQWFKEKPEISKSFDWQQFNLDLDGMDSTIWIGSKGAHTNCHQDTYGCNLIAQTHGRKLWLLFSPECTDYMQPTRIPYEESTIYSKYNFFTPSEFEIQSIKTMPSSVKIVILEPKDVLFVPKGWWHYVECLDTSLSVNIWLPLKEDCNARLQETLVHLIMNTIGTSIPKTIDQPDSNLQECMQFVDKSLQECKEHEKDIEPLQKRQKIIIKTSDFLENLKTKYHNHIKLLSDLNCLNMNVFINKNNVTKINNIEIDHNINKINDPKESTVLEAVINALCHPSITSKVSQILLSKIVRK